MNNTYQIIDLQTKHQIGKDYTEGRRARSRAEKLKLQYGAHRYTVNIIFADEKQA